MNYFMNESLCNQIPLEMYPFRTNPFRNDTFRIPSALIPSAMNPFRNNSLHWRFNPEDPEGISFTLFEIFIFCPKIQLWFPEKIVDLFGWKTHENVVVLGFLAVDNFDFTRKIVKKNLVEKSWKFDFSNSV